MSGIFSISLQQADPTVLMLQKCNSACFVRKFQNICYNKKHFVSLFIANLFLQYIACVGSHPGLISFLWKCKLDSLPSQTQSTQKWTVPWACQWKIPFCALLWKNTAPVKLTCRRCVFFRFWSPSFKVWTWLFSCCLSSKLFSSSASRCFSSSLIFNSCCSDRGEQLGLWSYCELIKQSTVRLVGCLYY